MKRTLAIVVLLLMPIGNAAVIARSDEAVVRPGPGTRIGGFFRELVGYLKRSDRVDVGDEAPDFELVPLRFYDFDLGAPDHERNAHTDPYRGVRLSAFKHVRPVALIFGSYT